MLSDIVNSLVYPNRRLLLGSAAATPLYPTKLGSTSLTNLRLAVNDEAIRGRVRRGYSTGVGNRTTSRAIAGRLMTATMLLLPCRVRRATSYDPVQQNLTGLVSPLRVCDLEAVKCHFSSGLEVDIICRTSIGCGWDRPYHIEFGSEMVSRPASVLPGSVNGRQLFS